MIEKLLANPYAGDGKVHPDMHLIYIDEICGLFKLAGLSEDGVKKKVFPLSLEGKALTGYRLLDDTETWDWNRLKLEFHQKFILCIWFIVIGIIYIIFGLVKDKVSLKLGGGLNI
jgi:hypothetical protein